MISLPSPVSLEVISKTLKDDGLVPEPTGSTGCTAWGNRALILLFPFILSEFSF